MFFLNQVLHGYRDGHRQLAASLQLDADSARMASMASDLSTILDQQYDGYLTGYYIDNARFFVFSKTWFASEVSRPGSVWTHSLLISYDDLEKISNLAFLRTLFRRPLGNDFSSYMVSIEVENLPPSNRGLGDVTEISRSRISAIINEIYGNDDTTILLPSDSALEWEDAFLDVWSLAWPGLRKRITFSTSMSEAKKLSGRPVDLVAVPRSAVHHVSRTVNAVIVNLETSKIDTWAVFLGLAMRMHQPAMKDFFCTVGEFFPSKRSSLKMVADILVALTTWSRDRKPLPEFVMFLNGIIPVKTRRPIMTCFLNPGKKSWIGLEDPFLIEELLVISVNLDIDANGLDIGKRVRRVLEAKGSEWILEVYSKGSKFVAGYQSENKSDAILPESLGFSVAPREQYEAEGGQRVVLSALWKEAAETWANFILEKAPSDVEKIPSLLLPNLIGYCPALLRYIDVDGLGSSAWTDIACAIVVSPDAQAEEIFKVAISELRRHSGRFARQLYERDSDTVISAVLQSDLHARDIPRAFKAILVDHLDKVATHIMRQEKHSMAVCLLLAEVVAASDRQLTEEERFGLIELGKNEKEKAGSLESNLISIVQLIAGLRDAATPILLLTSFTVVHDLLETQSLSWEAREILEECLPLLHSYDRWDMCNRLRAVVLRRFLQYGWDVGQLASMVKLSVREQLRSTLRWDLHLSRKVVENLLDGDSDTMNV